MATKKPQPKSVLSQLQSVGEGAIGKIAHNTTARSALQGAMNLKDRGEQLVTGLIAVEKRLAAVEKRLAALEGQTKGATGARAVAGRASAAAKPRSTATKSRSTPAKPRSRATKPKTDA